MRRMKLVAALALMPALYAAGQASSPAGLDRVLRGAVPGVTLEAFQAAHPKAAALELPADAQAQPETASEVTMTESLEQDPLLGLECHVNYGFRNGLLREFVILWGGSQERVKEDLKEFFQACIWKHGPWYSRDVIQINPRSESPRMVPVLVWKTDAGTFLASLSWNPDSKRAPGTLSYSLYAPDDPFVDIVLIADELAPEVVRDAFAEVQPVLAELAQIGDVKPGGE